MLPPRTAERKQSPKQLRATRPSPSAARVRPRTAGVRPSVQRSGVRGGARPDPGGGALALPSGQTLSWSPGNLSGGPKAPPTVAWRWPGAPRPLSGETTRAPPVRTAASRRLARAT